MTVTTALRTKSALLNDLAHRRVTLPPWTPRNVAGRLRAVFKLHSKDGVLVVVAETPEDPMNILVDTAVDEMLRSLIRSATAMDSIPCDSAIADALRARAGEDFAKVWLEYVEDLGL
jgi:hypothetical protein